MPPASSTHAYCPSPSLPCSLFCIMCEACLDTNHVPYSMIFTIFTIFTMYLSHVARARSFLRSRLPSYFYTIPSCNFALLSLLPSLSLFPSPPCDAMSHQYSVYHTHSFSLSHSIRLSLSYVATIVYFEIFCWRIFCLGGKSTTEGYA